MRRHHERVLWRGHIGHIHVRVFRVPVRYWTWREWAETGAFVAFMAWLSR